MNEIETWLRQPNETDTAYQSFLLYLELPRPRTLDKAAEATGHSLQNMKNLSSKYKWIRRAKLYDQYMQQQVAEKVANKVADNLVSVQEQITAAALEDGGKLRNLWNKVVDDLETSLDEAEDAVDVRRIALALNTMVTARKVIDDMIRKSARMPSTYKSELVEEEEFIGEYIISANGPPIKVLDDGEES